MNTVPNNLVENSITTGSSLVETFIMIIKYRWFIFWFVFLFTLGATLFATFSSKWYKSTASVLPAEKNDLISMAGISNLAKGFSASKGLAALTGGNSESDKFIAILKSATITKEVINKFNLRKEYNLESAFYEVIVKEWQSNCEIEVQEQGNLTITVYDKSPRKAAEIANYLVQRLNEKNTELSIINAKANKEFIEKRYEQSIFDIEQLEMRMKIFQQKFGLISVPEQLEATIKSMSEIYAGLYKKQVERDIIKQTYGNDHPIFIASEIEVEELEKKINKLNSGTDLSQNGGNFLIPFQEAPQLGNEYIKIYRNLEIQYKILEFIQPLFEQAKVEEVRNTPSVLVLDSATASDHKSKPKILLYFLLSFVISISTAFIIIVIIEMIIKLGVSFK